MLRKKRHIVVLLSFVFAAYLVWAKWPGDTPLITSSSPYHDIEQWPELGSPVDAALELRVSELLAKMTLREKVAQMTQGEIQNVRPEQLLEWPLGSILSAGGSWPRGTPAATIQATYRVMPIVHCKNSMLT